MATHILITTPNTLTSVGASYEAATLGAAVSVHVERTSATPVGMGIHGWILPHGIESAWPAYEAARFPAGGGFRLAHTPLSPVGIIFPHTQLSPNVNSTNCQSRGRMPLTH